MTAGGGAPSVFLVAVNGQIESGEVRGDPRRGAARTRLQPRPGLGSSPGSAASARPSVPVGPSR